MTSACELVNRLHRVYCERTGFDIALNFMRERQWSEWLRWRTGRPFSEEDLVRVISYIRRGIGKGERNEGALKFTNLIGSPDRFEEDLSLALEARNSSRPYVPSRTYRPIEPPAPGETMSPEEFAELRRELGVITRKPAP